MPVLVDGFTYEQKVEVLSAPSEADINTEITTQAADDWIVGQITTLGTDVIILFARNVADVLP